MPASLAPFPFQLTDFSVQFRSFFWDAGPGLSLLFGPTFFFKDAGPGVATLVLGTLDALFSSTEDSLDFLDQEALVTDAGSSFFLADLASSKSESSAESSCLASTEDSVDFLKREALVTDAGSSSSKSESSAEESSSCLAFLLALDITFLFESFKRRFFGAFAFTFGNTSLLYNSLCFVLKCFA